MNDKPILFSAPMVRAILTGTKTQTRRVIKCPPHYQIEARDDGKPWPWMYDSERDRDHFMPCPYGEPGTRLWVREAFMHEPADYCWEASVSIPCRPASTVYRADFPDSKPGEGWKPSIHMPRNLSRITLEIVDVRVERLQDISEADCQAEGIESYALNGRKPTDGDGSLHLPAGYYRYLWESINGPGSWDANPWVWCVEFQRA